MNFEMIDIDIDKEDKEEEEGLLLYGRGMLKYCE
jgi:hypothetical protein